MRNVAVLGAGRDELTAIVCIDLEAAANEAGLHNPGPETRTDTVNRPHTPEGAVVEVSSVVEVGGRPHEGPGPIRVNVPPGSTGVVRLVASGAAGALAGRSGCTVFEPAAEIDPLAAAVEELPSTPSLPRQGGGS